MTELLSIILIVLAGVTCVPVAVFFVEVAAALPPLQPRNLGESDSSTGSPTVVLIPAYNESSHLVPTLEDVRVQLREQDRLIVIADNCDDDTAEIAAAHGAEVLVRYDKVKIGKGYALAWGLSHLQSDPPDFVVFIDADCRVQLDMLSMLRPACRYHRRPVQACFMMRSQDGSPINHSLAEFAWIIKNWVRPLGLRALGFPVQLMGTGMIFSWADINSVSLASGHIVEDLKLGLDLAERGRAARFSPFVVVTSYFPTSEQGTQTQRQRWVHGHLSMIAKTAPRRFLTAIRQFNLEYFVLLLDLIVPPLTLLALMVASVAGLSALAFLLGASPVAATISALNLLAFIIAVVMAWLRFGRDALSVGQIGRLVPLFFEKIRLYSKIASGKTSKEWIRTDRDKTP